MVHYVLNATYSNCIKFVEKFTQNKFWEANVILISLLCALFVSFPCYRHVSDYSTNVWRIQSTKFANPLEDTSSKYDEHFSKTTFRLTVPIIAYLFRLDMRKILILQFFLGIILFYLICKITEGITRDRVLSLVICLMVGFTYAGIAAFVDLYGFFDPFAYFFLIAALFFKNPFLVGTGVFLSAWTDERGLIASGLILLYHSIEISGENRITVSTRLKLVHLSIVLSWFLYLIIRSCLTTKLKLGTNSSGIGFSVLIMQRNMILRSIWTGLEGGWIIVLFALATFFRKKSYFFLFFYSVSILSVVITALCVDDKVRSMAYILPALFIALKILMAYKSAGVARLYCIAAMFISLFSPNYTYFGAQNFEYFKPLLGYLIR